MCTDNGYNYQGIAGGGFVDTPEGDWYSVLFQDRGAVGRMPVLVPVSFKNGAPVFAGGKSSFLNLQLGVQDRIICMSLL